MPYRYLPWKRNILKVPNSVLTALEAIDTEMVTAAVIKSLRKSEILNIYQHLNFPTFEADIPNALPQPDLGKYSERNLHGWENSRRDLPKIKKTYYWETPNFGNASRYGTHVHYQEREVYPVEYHEPRMWPLAIEMLREGVGEDSPSIYKIYVDAPLDRKSPSFDDDLLFALNLLQENVGSIGIYSNDANRQDYLRTLHLDWQFFPPGEQEDFARRIMEGREISPEKKGRIERRIALFSRLKPQAFLEGKGGMSAYIGAKYADDLVVFENMNYGNALYVLYDDWEEISQRSRSELINGDPSKIDRIVHKDGWEDVFRKILQREKRKRRI